MGSRGDAKQQSHEKANSNLCAREHFDCADRKEGKMEEQALVTEAEGAKGFCDEDDTDQFYVLLWLVGMHILVFL